MTAERLKFRYTFKFKTGRKETVAIELDAETLALISVPRTSYPEWTRRELCKCENCPIQNGPSHCPVAVNLLDAAEHFSTDLSYEEVIVTIETPARSYSKKTALHETLRSLFGIYMVTSGCPVLDKLRPLVQMHLPFSTIQETAFRAISMYVLAQFFIQKKGGTPDWSLEGLGKIYKEIEVVNRALHQRLQKAGFSDACLNAIGNLNCYAQFTQMFIEPGALEKIEKLFAAYLK